MIPYATSYISEDDIKAVESVLRSNWLTRGKITLLLEDKLCEVSGKKHAVAVSNGTVALMAALWAARNMTTYSTTLTFSAVANAAYYANSSTTPELYDVDVDTLCTDWSQYWGLDGSLVAMDYAGYPSLTERPRHFIGSVILDAAHSLGAKLESGESNTHFADMATYSFHPAKLATSGEGGAVVTDDDDLYEELLMFRNNGFEPGTHEHVTFGINAHLGEMGAALALSQLKRLRESIERRQEIANYYYSVWEDDPRVILPAWSQGHSWHLFPIRFSEVVKADIPTIQKDLLDWGVTVQRHYRPLHMQPIYKHQQLQGLYPIAEHAYNRLISIPMYYGLQDLQVAHVIGSINKVMEKYS